MANRVIALHEIRYSDLESSSPPHAVVNQACITLKSNVIDVLGPSGPGLLSITGVPQQILKLRRSLLIEARELALIHPDLIKRVLKEHKLGSDVALKDPRRTVSSFATNLKFEQSFSIFNIIEKEENSEKADCSNLRFKLEMLASWMRNLGLLIARLCDEAIGGNELEQSLMESESAKGRLIHYHHSVDYTSEERSGVTKTKSPTTNEPDLWQQWHYDYGIFTVLTAPMFLSPLGLEATSYPDELSCLQIFDKKEDEIKMVKVDPESFLIQVGESAEVLSKGKLQATLHSVFKPMNDRSLSREMFVLFLQPSWKKTFEVSLSDEANNSVNQFNTKFNVLHTIVPPLSSRLKKGMTFAEFSRETTKQYYGVTGLQS